MKTESRNPPKNKKKDSHGKEDRLIPLKLIKGGGEMAERFRAFDWSKTP